VTYDYECSNPDCRHKWKLEQRITAPALTVCVRCKRVTAKRLISGGGAFQLKGRGWAKDGYK